MDLFDVKDMAIYGTHCYAIVKQGDDDVARFIAAKEKYFDVKVDGGMLTVTQKSRSFFSRIIAHKIEIQIILPRGFKGKLRFRNENGGMFIDGGDFTEVELSTRNGKFEISNVNCKSFFLKTKNGSVFVKRLNADDNAVIKCKNGSVRAETVNAPAFCVSSANASLSAIDVVAKKFECTTNNGAVDASAIDSDDLKLETNNGKISAAPLGARDDYRLNAETAHGAITVDGIAYKRLADAFRAAKRMNAKTLNGDIDIRFM